MKIIPTPLAGVMRVEITAHQDERGLFARTFDADLFAAHGMPTHWPHCNVSWNPKRGTLRGLHFQMEPRPEPKLVRCTRGAIWDVAVDLRPQSATYCRWTAAELTADNRSALFIPPGFAHGFLTLADDSEVFYQMGDTYVADLARGVRWDDPAFAIEWPFAPRIIGERDATYGDFRP